MYDTILSFKRNNGLLLRPDIDAYFNSGDFTFNSLTGKVEFAKKKKLPPSVVKEYQNYKIDSKYLTKRRKKFLELHKKFVFDKPKKDKPKKTPSFPPRITRKCKHCNTLHE